MVQALTGFNNLALHTSNKAECESDICRLCLEETEEFWHLASDCPAIFDLWVSSFGPSGPIPGKWQLSELEKFVSNEAIEELLCERPE